MKNQQMKHSNVKDIVYNSLKIQSYMTSPTFTNEMVSLLFNMRCSMTKGFKSNFSSMFKGDMGCKLNCNIIDALDNQKHLLEYPIILSKYAIGQATSAKYDDIFGSLEEQRQVTLVLAKALEERNQLLEVSLPVGQNTGPDPTSNVELAK